MSLISIDVGTTHLKAAAYSPDGKLLAIASRPTPTDRLVSGGAEYDPEQIWQTVADCLRQVVAQIGSGPVLAVGVASMAEAGFFVDQLGNPVTQAISWFDPRTRPQTSRLEAMRTKLYHQTGQVLQPKWSVLKMLWLKENLPEQYARAATWFSMMDWIIFRLCGARVTDPSLAVRTMAFDLTKGAWATDLLDDLRISTGFMPRVIPTGSPAGEVGAAAAALTGLPTGTTVVASGHDHPCAAVATSAVAPGALLDSTGTAEALIGTSEQLVISPQGLDKGMSITQLAGGTYALIAGVSASGGSIEWLRREVIPGASYVDLQHLLEVAGDHPSRIAFLPHLAGGGPPAVNPDSRAAWIGLTYAHTQAHMVRAVFEGVVFEVRQAIDAMESVLQTRFAEVTLTGGAAKNPAWLQMRADILGRKITVDPVEEATLLGAALLAGVGAGLWRTPLEVASMQKTKGKVYEPRPGHSMQYDAFFTGVYAPLATALRPIYSALATQTELD